jgi:hypothetical protein
MKRLQIVCLVIALCETTALCAEGSQLQSIIGKDPRSRSEAANQVVNDRSVLIKGLVGCVASKETDIEVKITAIEVLGALRAEEAIPVLLENLLVKERSVEVEGGLVGDFPAASSLISIGMGSVRAILSKRNPYLKEKLNRRKLKILAYIIEKVLTPPMARSVLAGMIESAPDQVRKENLLRMQEIRNLR